MLDAQYFSAIFELIPTPAVVLKPGASGFTIVDVNRAYLDITGSVRDELIGNDLFETFPGKLYNDIYGQKDILQKVINDKQPVATPLQCYEYLRNPDAAEPVRYFETMNTPVLNHDGVVELILRTVTDVTTVMASKAREDAAKERLEHNQVFLTETQRVARSGSWEVDFENKRVNVSGVLREIFEVADDFEMDFETSMQFLKAGDHKDKLIAAVNEAISNSVMFDLEAPIVTNKGNERWVRITGKAENLGPHKHRIYGATQDITERKLFAEALSESAERFKQLVQTVQGIVWEADAQTFEFTFVSDKVYSILGYTAQEWLSRPDFWQEHIYDDDRAQAVNFCIQQTQQLKNHTFDYRMVKSDGSLVWIKDLVCIISENGKLRWLRGIMVDVTETKRLADLDQLAKTVFELTAKKDKAIEDVLTIYLKGVEAIFPRMRCSILRVEHNQLYNWSAPSLPVDYIRSIEKLPIGPHCGSCGTAAYLKAKVIASDIATDARWEDYKELALAHNLRACWSYPIFDTRGEVLAVFGLYYEEVKAPEDDELEIIRRSAEILQIVLENWQNTAIIEQNAVLMKRGEELASFGTWQWDITSNTVTWSDFLYQIYGIDKNIFKSTFEGYLELLHPDDREAIYSLITGLMVSKQDIVFEERIIRPSGEMRYLRSWARVHSDAHGNPLKMFGACLDVTDYKKAELKMNQLHNELEEQVKVLEASEKRYSNLFHLSPLPMWVYDIDTLQFLSVNAAAIDHYGYSREEFLTMKLPELAPAAEIARITESIEKMKRENALSYSGVFKHRKKNGEFIQVYTQSNFIEFGQGNTHLELATDITDRQNYIDAIEKQNRQLQEIAWVQSHIVRAPLARIMGLIELFNSDKTTMDDKHEITAHILTSAHELDGIIRDISGKVDLISLSWNGQKITNEQ